MWSYSPLHTTLASKNINLDDLVKRKVITKTMRDHIYNKDDIPMRVIGNICNALRCNIGDVIMHVKSERE